MTRYNIYYTKYSILNNAYNHYVKVVYTYDIYHEIGKLICTSMERIKDISYTKPQASETAIEVYLVANGYVKITDTFYRKEGAMFEKK